MMGGDGVREQHSGQVTWGLLSLGQAFAVFPSC